MNASGKVFAIDGSFAATPVNDGIPAKREIDFRRDPVARSYRILSRKLGSIDRNDQLEKKRSARGQHLKRLHAPKFLLRF